MINDRANLSHPCVANNKVDRHVHPQAHNHVKFRPTVTVITGSDLECHGQIRLIVSTSIVNDALHGDGAVLSIFAGINIDKNVLVDDRGGTNKIFL